MNMKGAVCGNTTINNERTIGNLGASDESGNGGFSNVRGGTHKNEIFPICSKYDSECSKLL